ncbi:hypothetical protein N9W34_06345, partial [Rickettsiales bacterium]|nr:hypothetical protein [Rickettsiales bacterium]
MSKEDAKEPISSLSESEITEIVSEVQVQVRKDLTKKNFDQKISEANNHFENYKDMSDTEELSKKLEELNFARKSYEEALNISPENFLSD